MVIICVNSLRHIHHIWNEKYKWMRLDNIYHLIMNVPLFCILNTSNGDICGTQHKIAIKHISVINNLSA